MLVSNTDTTTSLSRRTSLTTFRTASSNSSSLFNTCTQEQRNLLLIWMEKTSKNAWWGKRLRDQSRLNLTFTLVNRGRANTHHQGIKGVNECQRKPTEKAEEMLWWEPLAQHSGAGVPLSHWSSLICNEQQIVKYPNCWICSEVHYATCTVHKWMHCTVHPWFTAIL